MTTIDGDVYVRGTLRTDGFEVPYNSVGDAQFNSADPLAATSQEQQINEKYVQAHGVAVATARASIHTAFAPGEVVQFSAKVVTIPIGGATVVVDLKKNGTTILSGMITLDNASVAFQSELGTISTPTYTTDDEFEVVVTAAAGGGTLPQGLSVLAVFREGAG